MNQPNNTPRERAAPTLMHVVGLLFLAGWVSVARALGEGSRTTTHTLRMLRDWFAGDDGISASDAACVEALEAFMGEQANDAACGGDAAESTDLDRIEALSAELRASLARPDDRSEPTARDAVAGMLLRYGREMTADKLVSGAITADEAIERIRLSDDAGNDASCIAALEALARGTGRRIWVACLPPEGSAEHIAILRERVVALEMQLTEARRERDEAHVEAAALRKETDRTKDWDERTVKLPPNDTVPVAKLRAALEAEAAEHDRFSGDAAQSDARALRRGAAMVQTEREARLVLSTLGFEDMAIDRILGGARSPTAVDGTPKPWRGIEHRTAQAIRDWHTTALARDGAVYVAAFSGSDAEERAREYAAFVSALAAHEESDAEIMARLKRSDSSESVEAKAEIECLRMVLIAIGRALDHRSPEDIVDTAARVFRERDALRDVIVEIVDAAKLATGHAPADPEDQIADRGRWAWRTMGAAIARLRSVEEEAVADRSELERARVEAMGAEKEHAVVVRVATSVADVKAKLLEALPKYRAHGYTPSPTDVIADIAAAVTEMLHATPDEARETESVEAKAEIDRLLNEVEAHVCGIRHMSDQLAKAHLEWSRASDTAYQRGQEEMRERAAAHVEDDWNGGWAYTPANVSAAIRALPIAKTPTVSASEEPGEVDPGGGGTETAGAGESVARDGLPANDLVSRWKSAAASNRTEAQRSSDPLWRGYHDGCADVYATCADEARAWRSGDAAEIARMRTMLEGVADSREPAWREATGCDTPEKARERIGSLRSIIDGDRMQLDQRLSEIDTLKSKLAKARRELDRDLD